MMFDRVLGGLEAPTASQLAAALQTGLVEVRRPSSLDVRVGRLSDVGQVRQLNEDSLLTIEIGRVRRSISEPLGLYAVCDGMGGHSAGDVASGLATADVGAQSARRNDERRHCRRHAAQLGRVAQERHPGSQPDHLWPPPRFRQQHGHDLRGGARPRRRGRHRQRRRQPLLPDQRPRHPPAHAAITHSCSDWSR